MSDSVLERVEQSQNALRQTPYYLTSMDSEPTCGFFRLERGCSTNHWLVMISILGKNKCSKLDGFLEQNRSDRTIRTTRKWGIRYPRGERLCRLKTTSPVGKRRKTCVFRRLDNFFRLSRVVKGHELFLCLACATTFSTKIPNWR